MIMEISATAFLISIRSESKVNDENLSLISLKKTRMSSFEKKLGRQKKLFLKQTF